MVSLATEVAGKKISSEEETFSDISITIFAGNLEVRHLAKQAHLYCLSTGCTYSCSLIHPAAG